MDSMSSNVLVGLMLVTGVFTVLTTIRTNVIARCLGVRGIPVGIRIIVESAKRLDLPELESVSAFFGGQPRPIARVDQAATIAAVMGNPALKVTGNAGAVSDPAGNATLRRGERRPAASYWSSCAFACDVLDLS